MKGSFYSVLFPVIFLSVFMVSCDKDGDEPDVCSGGSGCVVSDFLGNGTASQVSPNTCGDRPITVTNDGVDQVTFDMPVELGGVSTSLIMKGTVTDCRIVFSLDSVTDGSITAYYSGSANLNGNVLCFTYHASYNFDPNGFDCDYRFEL